MSLPLDRIRDVSCSYFSFTASVSSVEDCVVLVFVMQAIEMPPKSSLAGNEYLKQYQFPPAANVVTVEEEGDDQEAAFADAPPPPESKKAGGEAKPPTPEPPSEDAANVEAPLYSPPSERRETARPDDEWEVANTAAMKRATEAPDVSQCQPITFVEAHTALMKDRKEWEPTISEITRVAAHVETGGLWGCLWSCLHSEIVEGSYEYDERDFILCQTKIAFSHTHPIHRRVLLTIHRRVTKPKRSDPDVPTIGTHWEKLGFQGDNPGTDLRSTGVYGLLQWLYLIDQAPLFGDALWKAATNGLTNFTLAIVLFNFSGVAFEALKDRALHDEIHKRGKVKSAKRKERGSSGDASASGGGMQAYGSDRIDKMWDEVVVGEVLNDFFIGAVYAFYTEWIKQPTRSTADFPPIKAKLRPYCREHAAEMLKNAKTACDRKTWLGSQNRAKVDVKKIVTDDKKFGFTSLEDEGKK